MGCGRQDLTPGLPHVKACQCSSRLPFQGNAGLKPMRGAERKAVDSSIKHDAVWDLFGNGTKVWQGRGHRLEDR